MTRYFSSTKSRTKFETYSNLCCCAQCKYKLYCVVLNAKYRSNNVLDVIKVIHQHERLKYANKHCFMICLPAVFFLWIKSLCNVIQNRMQIMVTLTTLILLLLLNTFHRNKFECQVFLYGRRN